MFKHILVPLDGSVLAEKALPPALELARSFDSKITLVRIAQIPTLPSVDGFTFAELHATLREQAREEASAYLRAQAGSLRQQGYNVHHHLEVAQPVAECILETADLLNVDAIVMSTHGLGGVRRWVYGSVADKVLRHAKVPVLLIRANEERMALSISDVDELTASLN
jgi:nucleotide-binding universal stress UspA family protein